MKVIDRERELSRPSGVDHEPAAESSRQRLAGMAAAAGFSIIAMFQLALALGAPWGQASWGGTHEGQLPTNLRIGSAMAVAVWTFAALIILKRAGFRGTGLSSGFARRGTWALVGISTLGALPQFASSSNWERFMWGPFALTLAVLCFVMARHSNRA